MYHIIKSTEKYWTAYQQATEEVMIRSFDEDIFLIVDEYGFALTQLGHLDPLGYAEVQDASNALSFLEARISKEGLSPIPEGYFWKQYFDGFNAVLADLEDRFSENGV